MSRVFGFVVMGLICFGGCRPVQNTSEVDVQQVESQPVESSPVEAIGAFQVKFETSKGIFVMDVHPEWAPAGAKQFRSLVESGFYDGCRFFRVLDGFMAQFGINGDPAVQAKWRDNPIADEPVKESNKRGYVSYAMGGPNTRTSQLFISYGDNANLDGMGFSPFAKVISGMDVVDKFYNGYGEGAPQGRGPAQGRLQEEGNAYLEKEFPKLDYIRKATIIESGSTGEK